MSEPTPDISVIVVNYNTRDLLAACLHSVTDCQAGTAAEVWVVDNASTDGSADMVAAAFPAVQLIRNAHNLGFAAANNQVMQQAHGDLILLLNSDAALQPGCLVQLQAAFAEYPTLGIAGPQLLNSDGTIQPSWGDFPTSATEFVFQSFLFKFWPVRFPYGRRIHVLQRPAYRRFQWADGVTGAAFMLRRKVLDQIGGLPQDTFLYAEDLEYCWRARQAGFGVAYCPSAGAYHVGQGSGRQDYGAWIENYTRGMLA